MFGCPAYAHVTAGKLDPKSIKCVFLGYGDSVKDYRLWCLDFQKLIYSRDVKFNEDEMLKSSPSENGQDTRKSPAQVELDLRGNQSRTNSQTVTQLEVSLDLLNIQTCRVDYAFSSSQSEGRIHVESSHATVNLREETTAAGDRPRRTISKPVRFRYDDFVYLAVNAAEDVNSSEPRNYEKAM